MKMEIVKQGEHKGFKYYVKFFDISSPNMSQLFMTEKYEGIRWYCGYVEIAENHELYNEYYMDLDFDVHGGLTFGSYLKETNTYCLGFDCNHWGDNYIDCDAEYTEKECLKLIDQIVNI